MNQKASAVIAEHSPQLTESDKRKRDALAMAELIYDMYKEEQQRENGDSNAQQDVLTEGSLTQND